MRQCTSINLTGGSVIISQVEVDTWTTHLPIGLDVDPASLDPAGRVFFQETQHIKMSPLEGMG